MNDGNEELIMYAVYRMNKKTGKRELLCRTLEKERAEALIKTAYNKDVKWSGIQSTIVLPQVEGELES